MVRESAVGLASIVSGGVAGRTDREPFLLVHSMEVPFGSPIGYGLSQRKRRWNEPSVRTGRQLATLKAQTNKNSPQTFQEARLFYEDRFRSFGKELPGYLLNELVWAERTFPDFFLALMDRDVLPLILSSWRGVQ